jgi:uncharacterized membrane protein YagU involved in acid resistance
MFIPYFAILVSGLVAGALDLTFACVSASLHGHSSVRILQAIASAAIGPSSFQLGAASAALGAFFHFFISVSAAAVYYLASRHLPLLTRRPFPSGAVFGVCVYLVMHLVILPLSFIGLHLPSLANALPDLCSHIFLFGMVIAYGVARARNGHRIAKTAQGARG